MFIVILIIYILICVVFYYLKPYKNNTPQKNYQKFLKLYNSTLPGFFYEKTDNGQYVNIHIDTKTGLLERKIEDKPLLLDGEFYNETVSWGEVTYNDDGFSVSGMDLLKFKCPDGWYWDQTLKTCKQNLKCIESDVNVIRPLFNESNIMHQKLYVYCRDKSHYTIETCPDNTIFNGVLEPQDPKISPCNKYDFCIHQSQYYKHRFNIDDYILKPNEYYICENKKSKLSSCLDTEYFDIKYNTCVPLKLNQCYNKPNGTKLPFDEYSYIECQNGLDNKIYCNFGVTENLIECKKPDCINKFTRFYENTYVKMPIEMSVCDKNNNATIAIIDKLVIQKYQLTINNTKAYNDLPDETERRELIPIIEYNQKVFKMNGEIVDFSSMKDIIDPKTQLPKEFPAEMNAYIKQPSITLQYHKLIPGYDYDWFRGIGLYYKYFLLNGKIINDKKEIISDNPKEYLAFVATNELQKLKISNIQYSFYNKNDNLCFGYCYYVTTNNSDNEFVDRHINFGEFIALLAIPRDFKTTDDLRFPGIKSIRNKYPNNFTSISSNNGQGITNDMITKKYESFYGPKKTYTYYILISFSRIHHFAFRVFDFELYAQRVDFIATNTFIPQMTCDKNLLDVKKNFSNICFTVTNFINNRFESKPVLDYQSYFKTINLSSEAIRYQITDNDQQIYSADDYEKLMSFFTLDTLLVKK